MIVETDTDYKNFLDEITVHTLILSIIPQHSNLHPSVNTVSVLLVKDIKTNKTYIFSFRHPDGGLFYKDISSVISDIAQKTTRIWVDDKKLFLHFAKRKGFNDIDLFTHLKGAWVLDRSRFETNAHRLLRRNNNHDQHNLNNVIPLLKHKETFEAMCSMWCEKVDLNDHLDMGYQKENEIILETLSDLESVGVYVDEKCFKTHFQSNIWNGLVFTQYNIYTSTGRPSNRFDNVNYAALNKNDGSRKCFISRYGDEGKMVLIDYSAFHPRIICKLVDFPIPLETNIYEYLGDLYFKHEATDYDLEQIKTITMRQLYGGVEEKYEHINYFSKLKSFIMENWLKFQKDGYVTTPIFNRVITSKHVLGANPNKLFNYILQATETEIAVSALKIVNDFLRDRLTKAVIYTYDSVLFDFYKGDAEDTLKTIVEIMKMGNRFPVKVYEGNSYDDVVQTYL